jgi:ABC-2 type transport system ATP-binding protein
VAQTLRLTPGILYLDEPTIGLDVVAKQRIRDFLGCVNQERDLTVILTTHDMTDIAQLCQRMLLIDHGRLLYDGAVAASRDRFGVERTLVVDLAEDEMPDGPLNAGPAMQVQADGPRRWLRFRRDETTAAELIAAVSSRYRIRDLTIEEPEIEALVRRIYEEGL